MGSNKVRLRRLRSSKSRGSSPDSPDGRAYYAKGSTTEFGIHTQSYRKKRIRGGTRYYCVGGGAAFVNSCCRQDRPLSLAGSLSFSFSVTSSQVTLLPLISQDIIVLIIAIIIILAADRSLRGNYRNLSSPLISQPQYLSIHWPKSRSPKVEIWPDKL